MSEENSFEEQDNSLEEQENGSEEQDNSVEEQNDFEELGDSVEGEESEKLIQDKAQESEEPDDSIEEQDDFEELGDGEQEVEGEEEEPKKLIKRQQDKAQESENKWYSLRVISGKERKIKERIDLEIDRSGWEKFITQVLVPTEKVYKIRNGKKMISERNILPGYILVEADPSKFSSEMVQTIANIPNVIHFLGKENPTPMRSVEANRLLGKVDESQDSGEALIEPFIVGETVKIIDGPFSEFVGDIQEVNEEKKKLKVIVKIFGRGTEVELNFMQVEKQA